MSRPCVCGGSNDNCRYCGGSGEIADRLASALVAHSKHPSKLNGGRKTKAEKKMETDVAIRTRSLRLQRFRSVISGTPSDGSVVSSLVPCPTGCGAQLEPRNINRHVHEKHKPAKKFWSAMASDSANREEWRFCPVCQARVKARKLQRHLGKVHKKTEVGKATGGHRPRVTSIVESVKDVLRDSTTLAAPRDKNLDITKLYAHSYREQGRFGSHPSHDGFDDESGPE